jgi:hypothetical protein
MRQVATALLHAHARFCFPALRALVALSAAGYLRAQTLRSALFAAVVLCSALSRASLSSSALVLFLSQRSILLVLRAPLLYPLVFELLRLFPAAYAVVVHAHSI